MNWPEFPGLRLSISFLLGIGIGSIISVPTLPTLIALIMLVSFNFIVDRRPALSDTLTITLSFLLLLGGFTAGLLRTNLAQEFEDNFHYTQFINDSTSHLIIGTIREDIKQKTSLKTTVAIKQVDGQNARGTLLIYFPREDSVSYFSPGDVIVFRSKILPSKLNSNPYAFDYKAYLKNRGISHQAYLRAETYKLVEKGKLSFLFQLTYDLRAKALSILEENLTSTEQLATASAMILGYRDHISEELYTAYATTGSVHVLAVSGLHVGIICWVFIALFKRIKSEEPHVKIFKAVSLILLVWFYAILTGAAPAVIRAAVMFTIIIIGKYWFDAQNIYNTLALSAVLLLMYDPLLLFQASFQFSYLALLGIVFFHKVLYPIYESRFVFVDKVWNLAVVAFAAQTLVFPVTVFYFHKFPLYFIISGILSVTLAFAILINGILVILLSSVPYLGAVLSFSLRMILDFFIAIIYFIRDLPMSNISGLWLSKSTTVLIYVCLAVIMILIHNRKKLHLLYLLGFAVIGLIYNNTIYNHRTNTQTSLTVYEVSGGSIIDIFEGKKCYSQQSPSLTKSNVNFAADNFRISSFIQSVDTLETHYKSIGKLRNGLLQYKDKTIFIPGLSEDANCIPQQSDILLITFGYDDWPNILMDNHKTKLIVIDKSIAWKKKRAWLRYAEGHSLAVHVVASDGAFML